MGKIKYVRTTKLRRSSFVRLWLIPVVLVAVSIFVVNITFADTSPPPTLLEQYLQNTELVPHSETVDGYQQVYYVYNKQKVFITSGNTNHVNPRSKGQYIVWLGTSNDTTSQVFLYNVLTNTTLQLSGYSTNTSPDISNGHVVWQQWVNDGWQIMYYDGMQVSQISDGSTAAFRPRINNQTAVYVSYVANDSNNTPWHVMQYSTQTGERSLILATATGSKAWPHFDRNGNLTSNYDLDYLGN